MRIRFDESCIELCKNLFKYFFCSWNFIFFIKTMNTTMNTSTRRSWIDESKRWVFRCFSYFICKMFLMFTHSYFRSNSKQPQKSDNAKPKPPNDAHLRILTGNVEFALRCSKMLPITTSVLIEVFGTVINIRPGGKSETIILLRNDTGPVLQLSYYSVQFPLPDELKDVRCMCRIKSNGGFHAVKVQPVHFCYEYIARLQAISVHFLKKLVNNPGMLWNFFDRKYENNES